MACWQMYAAVFIHLRKARAAGNSRTSFKMSQIFSGTLKSMGVSFANGLNGERDRLLGRQ
jgi:hypothetical protein